ncbi:hypothetical protein, partial [Mycobacterium sp.]|uniref:hypothetical protein n=1 Tax=Mycobacterium sp. TaxID=1785 RepID=UPI003F9BB8F5
MTTGPSPDNDIYGVSPTDLQLHFKSRMRRLGALVAIPIAALTTVSIATLISAPSAYATCNNNYCGDLPEWYQFCKNRTPGGTFSDRTQYFYKGATCLTKF